MPFRPRRSLRPIRPRLPRRAIPWYAAAALLTLATGALVTGSLRRAAEAEAAYGTTRTVAVVRREVAAGAVVGADDVDVREWPSALVPPDAVDTSPRGRTALVALLPGDVVVHSRLSGPDAEGLAALLGPDERAVPIPITVPGLELRTGDEVDVLAGGGMGGGPTGDLPISGSGPDVVVAEATVLGVDEDAVIVAVPAQDAAEVAAALTTGPLVLALRPPGV